MTLVERPFVYAKAKNPSQSERDLGQKGSMRKWTTIDADSKLVISYLIGARDAGYAWEFAHDVSERLSTRAQLTMDGHKPHLAAVDAAFGGEIDYAMLVKQYGEVEAGAGRDSPAQCCGIARTPEPTTLSTSTCARFWWSHYDEFERASRHASLPPSSTSASARGGVGGARRRMERQCP